MKAELIIGTTYLIVDILCMVKYLWQIQSLRKAKKAIGIARKYYVASLLRELCAISYGIVLGKVVLIILGSFSLIMNGIVLLLVIRYKKVPKRVWKWDDTIYDRIRTFMERLE